MFSLMSVGRTLILLHFVTTVCPVWVAAQNEEYWCTDPNTNPGRYSLLLKEIEGVFHFSVNNCVVLKEGTVREKGPELPPFPEVFSVHAQVSYKNTIAEIIESADYKRGKESIEVWAGKRHVRYISLAAEDAFLTVLYTQNGITCTTASLSKTDKQKAYDEKIAGPLGLIHLIQDKVLSKREKFVTSVNDFIRGRTVKTWEICEYVAELGMAVKVSLYYSDPTWTSPYQTDSIPRQELTRMKIEAHKNKDSSDDDISLTVDLYSFKPNATTDKDFQVPESVHCPNFRTDKSAPSIPNYFSYQSEILTEQTPGTSVVLHSNVYYDYMSKLIRVDTQKPKSGSTASVTPDSQTNIMDFNAGVLYTINTEIGSCKASSFASSMDFLTNFNSTQGMLKPMQFFDMEGATLSYMGEYETRGLPADVFSASVETPDKRKLTFFWCFTPDRTKLIGEEVEKNVLVKVVFRPESLLWRKNQTEINFYNFNNEQPNPFVFDISACYNESLSKTYVITFPGDQNALLEEYEYVLQYRMHYALRVTAGVSKQRISMQKITFGDKYFFVQFKILQLPVVGRSIDEIKKKENDLSKAADQIKNAVAKKKFTVSLRAKGEIIHLKAEPDGFKEFKEDSKEITFNESSVAGLTIGMTVLGFLLGGVVVNLIFTRKHGISLFQNALSGRAPDQFDNPLHESSM